MLSLLYRYLMLACLCWGGWFDVYGMILSVNVGFLYMEVVHLVGVLSMVMSRKFIWLFDSVSAVNVMLGWSMLKSSKLSTDVET